MAIQQISSVSNTPSKTSNVREVGTVAAVASTATTSTNTLTSVQTDSVSSAAAQPTREQIDQAMGEVRKVLAPVARNLQFSIDDETGRTVVKVMDSSTNEVIRQIPSEELLAMTRSMDKLSGLFVKQKV
ncbi:flagellar protein FlaG [Uliginosibacterium sediminicola]|uniref:Flagellar protein FlaG n=1 Tax=Uliginosibacterium sediminicola TaxID=2024550 RepID=A0ABU9Z2G2_9RHOO